MSVAATISAQLGGRPFAFLVKLYDRHEDEDSLSFSFYGSNIANRCAITSDYGRDSYNMVFCNGATVIEEYEDIYADQLQDIFQGVTGINLDTVRVSFG